MFWEAIVTMNSGSAIETSAPAVKRGAVNARLGTRPEAGPSATS